MIKCFDQTCIGKQPNSLNAVVAIFPIASPNLIIPDFSIAHSQFPRRSAA